jgi:hypothetical protein
MVLLLTPHSSLLTPHSSLLTPHSSLLTPHSSLLTPHSSSGKICDAASNGQFLGDLTDPG